MAKKTFLDYIGLQSYDGSIKDYISNALQNINAHIGNKENPHEVTKEQIGLTNTEDKSSETIRSELTFDNVRNALGYTPSSATELAEIRFTMNEEDGHLIMLYPDKSSVPDVAINSYGHLIYTY